MRDRIRDHQRQLSVWVDEGVLNRIDEIAERDHLAKADVVRDALASYVDADARSSASAGFGWVGGDAR